MKYGVWGPNMRVWWGPAHYPIGKREQFTSPDGKFETQDINEAYRYLEACFKTVDCDRKQAHVKERE